MNDGQLSTLIDQYRSGLDAEMALLRRIQQASHRQRDAASAHDLEALNRASDERDSLMAGLVEIEDQLRHVRKTLSEQRKEARNLPGYREMVELHGRATDLANDILKSDEEATAALEKAEQVRRDTARAMEQGETTLSAYRRVMSAPPGAALVDRRG
jgi:hypothetical protein